MKRGSRTNIVAEKCYIVAEARSLVDSKMEAQVAHMKEAILTAAAELGGKADVEVKVNYPSFNVEKQARLSRLQVKQLNVLVEHQKLYLTVGVVMLTLLTSLFQLLY